MRKILMFIFIAIIIAIIGFAGSITINSPNGGEKWIIGQNKLIKWNGSGLSNPVKITLWKNNILLGVIIKDQPANGPFNWSVGEYLGGSAVSGADYKVKIREQGGAAFTTEDMSTGYFEISRSPLFIVKPVNPVVTLIDSRPDFKVTNIYLNGKKFDFLIKNLGETYKGPSNNGFSLKFKCSIGSRKFFFNKFILEMKKNQSHMISTLKVLEQKDISCPNPKVLLSVRIDPDKQINEKNEMNNTLSLMHKHNLGPDYFIEDIAQGKKTVRTIKKRVLGKKKYKFIKVKRVNWPLYVKLKNRGSEYKGSFSIIITNLANTGTFDASINNKEFHFSSGESGWIKVDAVFITNIYTSKTSPDNVQVKLIPSQFNCETPEKRKIGNSKNFMINSLQTITPIIKDS